MEIPFTDVRVLFGMKATKLRTGRFPQNAGNVEESGQLGGVQRSVPNREEEEESGLQTQQTEIPEQRVTDRRTDTPVTLAVVSLRSAVLDETTTYSAFHV